MSEEIQYYTHGNENEVRCGLVCKIKHVRLYTILFSKPLQIRVCDVRVSHLSVPHLVFSVSGWMSVLYDGRHNCHVHYRRMRR